MYFPSCKLNTGQYHSKGIFVERKGSMVVAISSISMGTYEKLKRYEKKQPKLKEE